MAKTPNRRALRRKIRQGQQDRRRLSTLYQAKTARPPAAGSLPKAG